MKQRKHVHPAIRMGMQIRSPVLVQGVIQNQICKMSIAKMDQMIVNRATDLPIHLPV